MRIRSTSPLGDPRRAADITLGGCKGPGDRRPLADPVEIGRPLRGGGEVQGRDEDPLEVGCGVGHARAPSGRGVTRLMLRPGPGRASPAGFSRARPVRGPRRDGATLAAVLLLASVSPAFAHGGGYSS